MQEFFAMGGYAFYVWTSYAVALVVLLANVWWAAHSLKQVRRRTQQRAARPARRSGPIRPDTSADASTPSPLS